LTSASRIVSAPADEQVRSNTIKIRKTEIIATRYQLPAENSTPRKNSFVATEYRHTTPPRPSGFAGDRLRRSHRPATPPMSRSPAPLRCTTAAHYARQAAGRPLPALAGQRSAFLPTARHAPLSHNGPWWIAEIFVSRDSTALSTTTIMRSGLRYAPLGGGFTSTPSSIVHGVGVCVGSRWQTPPHHPAHPRPAAVGIADARPRL
jgi:hypothetical protein